MNSEQSQIAKLNSFYYEAMKYINQETCQNLCSHYCENVQCQQCKRELSDAEKIGGLLYKYFGTQEEFELYYRDDKLPKILTNAKIADVNMLKLAISFENKFNKIERNDVVHFSNIIIHNFTNSEYSIVETKLKNGSIYNRFYKSEDELSTQQIIKSVLRLVQAIKQSATTEYYDFCPHNLLIGQMPIEDEIKIFCFEFTFINKLCECKQENLQQAVRQLIHFLINHGTLEETLRVQEKLILGNHQIQNIIGPLQQNSIYFPNLLFKSQIQDSIQNTAQMLHLQQAQINDFRIKNISQYGLVTKFKLKIALFKIQFIYKYIQLLYQYNLPTKQHDQSLLIFLKEYIKQLENFKKIIDEQQKKEISDIMDILKAKQDTIQESNEEIQSLLKPYVSINSKFFFRLKWIKDFDKKFEIPQIYQTFKPYIIKNGKLSFKKFEQFLNEPQESIEILEQLFKD